MQPLVSAKAMKEADRFTIDRLGIDELILMEHAALAVVEVLEERFGALLCHTPGLLLAGTGNNGGDALAAARILYHRGCRHVSVVIVGDANKFSLSAKRQLEILKNLGVVPHEDAADFEWVIDGIFGTGLNAAVCGEPLRWIEKINALKNKWVVAIDIPSGLSADTGVPLGNAMIASETLTLGFIKKGLVTGKAADYVGRLRLATIQIPREQARADAWLFEAADAKASLPKRLPSSHKGNFGHVFVWAGSVDKEGASILSGLVALRTGAGLVTMLGMQSTLDRIRPRLPLEFMVARWDEAFEFPLSSVLAVGPGMGVSQADWLILEKLLSVKVPLVVDGDALTLISANRDSAKKLLKAREPLPTVLTPHPKEAARLLGVDKSTIEIDRYEACEKLANEFATSIILKGKGTICRSIGEGSGACLEKAVVLALYVVTAGTTGLAKGGSGDVLTGIVASLLAEGVNTERALPLASFLLGRASEILVEKGVAEHSMLASEISEVIKECMCARGAEGSFQN